MLVALLSLVVSADAGGDISELDLAHLLEVPDIAVASRREQSALEAPASVTVITAHEIQGLAVDTVAEVLRSVTGIVVQQHNQHDYNVGARGTLVVGNNRVRVKVDGRDVGDGSTGFVRWDLLPHPFDVERIEVVRGPVAALYGVNAFNGVINIITKRGSTSEGFAGQAQAGTFYLRGPSGASSTMQTGGTGYLAYGIANTERTLGARGSLSFNGIPDWTENATYPRARHGRNTYRAALNLDARPTDDASIQVQLSHAQAEYNYLLNTVTASAPSWTAENAINIVGDLQNLLDGALELRATASARVADYWCCTFSIPERTVESPLDRNGDVRLQGSAEAIVNLVDNRVFLVAGGEIINLTNSGLYGSNLHTRTISPYAQADVTLLDDRSLILSVAGRYDNAHQHNDEDDGSLYRNVSYRGSAVYRVSEQQALRFSASRAYRNPTAFENFIDNAIQDEPVPAPMLPLVAGNPRLRPERIDAFELGYRALYGYELSFDAAVFYQRVKDVIRWTDDPVFPIYWENTAPESQYGADFTLAYTPNSSVRATVGYAYTHARTDAGQVRYWPVHLANLFVEGRLDHDMRISGRVYAMMHSQVYIPVENVTRDNAENVIADVRFGKMIPSSDIELYVAGRNLLGFVRERSEMKHYNVSGAAPIGASVIVGLQYGGLGF
jgi:iron complex outermembrane receptor protein